MRKLWVVVVERDGRVFVPAMVYASHEERTKVVDCAKKAWEPGPFSTAKGIWVVGVEVPEHQPRVIPSLVEEIYP